MTMGRGLWRGEEEGERAVRGGIGGVPTAVQGMGGTWEW